MKKFVVMDQGGRRIDVEADSYTRTPEGVLVFVKAAGEVAAFATGQWAWVQVVTA